MAKKKSPRPKKTSTAKKKKTGPARKSASPKKSAAPKKKSSASGRLRTPFMDAFWQTFILPQGASAQIWPTASQLAPSIVADFNTFVNVLITVGFQHQPPTPDGSGSLTDRLMTFLQTQGWPNASVVPLQYQSMKSTVHLIEISVAIDDLLEAINAQLEGILPGGGGASWPPH